MIFWCIRASFENLRSLALAFKESFDGKIQNKGRRSWPTFRFFNTDAWMVPWKVSDSTVNAKSSMVDCKSKLWLHNERVGVLENDV